MSDAFLYQVLHEFVRETHKDGVEANGFSTPTKTTLRREARVITAIVGSGNIGTDLMHKLLASEHLDLRYMVGIDPASEGLRLARGAGVEASADGVDWLLGQDEVPELVFEATSAKVHVSHAPRYERMGIVAVDLTPAAIGIPVVPSVNLKSDSSALNLNMTTCGGQATVPIVAAVSRVIKVHYAEIVVSIASKSAGPGTRANIDEFTQTTARALERVGGADRGKAVIVLNPADPPIMMRNTVFCAIPDDAPVEEISESIVEMVDKVSGYVPGYRLTVPPQFDKGAVRSGGWARVSVFLEVEGSGDYLPSYAGNLDIMTAAAVRVGEEIAVATRGSAI